MCAAERKDYYALIRWLGYCYCLVLYFIFAPYRLHYKSLTLMDEIGKALQSSAKYKVANEQ